MAKSAYTCTNCDYNTVKWIGCCPGCSEWNSFIEKKDKPKTTSNVQPAKLVTLSSVKLKPQKRMTSHLSEWDRTLGGGILPGSFLILTGDPGIGKSTLLLQVASNIADNHKVIYFSSEESLPSTSVVSTAFVYSTFTGAGSCLSLPINCS